MPRLRNNAGMAFAVFVCALVCNAALADEHALPAQTDADLSGEIECAALKGQDFIDIPGAPTAVVSARLTSALETASVSPSFPGALAGRLKRNLTNKVARLERAMGRGGFSEREDPADI